MIDKKEIIRKIESLPDARNCRADALSRVVGICDGPQDLAEKHDSYQAPLTACTANYPSLPGVEGAPLNPRVFSRAAPRQRTSGNRRTACEAQNPEDLTFELKGPIDKQRDAMHGPPGGVFSCYSCHFSGVIARTVSGQRSSISSSHDTKTAPYSSATSPHLGKNLQSAFLALPCTIDFFGQSLPFLVPIKLFCCLI